MKIQEFASRLSGKAEAQFRKNGPTILTGLGVAGFGLTTVLVGRAVLRSQDKVKTLKFRTQEIKERELDEKYTRQQQSHDMGVLWLRSAKPILVDFAPAIVAGAASVTCVVTAHGMLKQQRAALVAAYAALDTGFRAYRKRVQDEIGESKELELFRGMGRVTVEDDQGQPCEIFDTADLQHHASQYAKFFDESSVYWKKTPEWNLTFLLSQQEFANQRLQARGFLFLNDVYEALGLPHTQAGQAVGWKRDKTGKNDGFVSFGIHDIFDESSRAFVNGYEHTILLDFNVDGVILID
jgi:hypothetical protein